MAIEENSKILNIKSSTAEFLVFSLQEETNTIDEFLNITIYP